MNLTNEQIESLWNAADRSRGDQAYFRSDVFDLIETINSYKSQVEEKQTKLRDTENEVQLIQNELINTKYKLEEMQKIIDTAVMYLQSNELHVKAQQIKAMAKSLKESV